VDYFDGGATLFEVGEAVIIRVPSGLDFAYVVVPRRRFAQEEIASPIWPVVRAATEEDLAVREGQVNKESEALRTCRQEVLKHNLPMKLLAAHFAFDESTLTFYFTAEGRVDFRHLVKQLANIFRVRIEMRQVGPRDEARVFPGFGPCGQPLCCARFLCAFEPVTIKMAKEQGVSLTPGKISGACGRLQCCLRFEYELYREEKKRMPNVGTRFEMEGCACRVVDCNPLTGQVAIERDGGGRHWVSREEVLPFCPRRDS
jgi:cell fate regulator YaaT (PSP1 superfamily)